MTSEILDFDLSSGFGWFAVLRVRDQRNPGRKVIFEVGHVNLPVSITIGVDEDDAFQVWLIDASSHEFCLAAIPKEVFWDRFVIAGFEIDPTGDRQATARLLVGDAIREEKIEADLGSRGRAQASIGADRQGQHNAAFDLAEMVQVATPIKGSDRKKLFEYFREKYRL